MLRRIVQDCFEIRRDLFWDGFIIGSQSVRFRRNNDKSQLVDRHSLKGTAGSTRHQIRKRKRVQRHRHHRFIRCTRKKRRDLPLGRSKLQIRHQTVALKNDLTQRYLGIFQRYFVSIPQTRDRNFSGDFLLL